jgi:hypothetical protein
MSAGPIQVERVIAAARSPDGVSQADMLLPDVIDGGAPITRVGARIQDAEERGFVFETIGWRDRCKVYRLLSEPEAATASVSDAASNVRALPEPEPPLFETPGAGTEHWRSDVA